jgi:hypothetical protein
MNELTTKKINSLTNKGLTVEQRENGNYLIKNKMNDKEGSFYVIDNKIDLPRKHFACGDVSFAKNINDLARYLLR